MLRGSLRSPTPATHARLCLYGGALLGLAVLALRTRLSSSLPPPSASLHAVMLRRRSVPSTPTTTTIHPTLDIPLDDDCCGAASSNCAPIPAKNHILLFASVPNVAAETSRRYPLRAQWTRSLDLMKLKMDARRAPLPRVELRFVVGTEGMSDDQLAAITTEAASTRDILLIDAPDRDVGSPRTRSATTLKVMHSMRYAVNHYLFDWFARIGDDAYFRVDYFAELDLDNAYPREWAYVGYKFSNHIVPPTDSTHNFIVGMGFLLTYDLAQFTCRAHRYLYDGFPEDAVVGSWYVGTKVRVLHEPRFHDVDHVTTVAYAPCTNTSLLMHHMWTQDRWDGIDENGLLQC